MKTRDKEGESHVMTKAEVGVGVYASASEGKPRIADKPIEAR